MSHPPHYAHAIIGGGVSGLTLAHYIADVVDRNTPIVLLDRNDDPDYNISFWTDGPTPFAPVMNGTWHTIDVRYADRRTVCPLSRYRLHAFWRNDFDDYLHAQLDEHPNVTRVDADVRAVADGGDHARVATAVGSFTADWAYDSRKPPVTPADARGLLVMQGLAVDVECVQPAFDPQVATLFDFLLKSPQFDFMYVLPYSRRRALVNAAFVTPADTIVTQADCQRRITRYLTERVGCTDFAITRACYGRLPLRTAHPRRRKGSRVMPIGTRAGMMKSSTSYAFSRIVTDAQRIAAALRETDQPYHGQRPAWYYRLADRYTARIFKDHPNLAQELMFAMFTPDNGDLALAFLDERNSLAENRRLFEGIPRDTLRGFLRELAVEMLPGVR